MSSINISRDSATGRTKLVLVLDAVDLASLDLDPFDQLVVNSDVQQAADILQSAEIVVRRMREQGIAFCGDAP